MKITDSTVIKNGEQELIDAIIGDLDWGVMEEIFKKDHRLEIGEDVEYKSGDIIVYDNQVAYRLEFDVKVNLSIIVDREGNWLSLKSSQDFNEEEECKEDEERLSVEHDEESFPEQDLTIPPEEGMQERISRVASTAGDMIREMGDEI